MSRRMSRILPKIPHQRVTVLSSSHGLHTTTVVRKDQLDLSFNDHEAAYRSKKTSEVVRAYAVLTLCGVKPLVTHNAKLMKLGQTILGKKLFGYLMKQSFYGHFVAGEDQDGIKPVISRMHSFGVKSILDYSVEVDEAEQKKEEKKTFKTKKASEAKADSNKISQYIPLDEDEHKEIDRTHNLNSARTFFYQGEAECDANMKVFIHCIDAVKGKNWEAFKKQVQKLDIDAS